MRRCTVAVEGVVQGVGFRPFVYRLARRHALTGCVRNDGRGVLIEAQGEPRALDRFLEELVTDCPPASQPKRVTLTWRDALVEAPIFRIDPSRRGGDPAPFPAPDLAMCDACRRELGDPSDRRHRYPFLNCTACGPRFTIIASLPYDRERTSMAAFGMCAACRAEYDDPSDRRFHAEPTACAACGPRLSLRDASGQDVAAPAIDHAAAALRSGAIVAVKGLGGYHLACDATSAAAVAELRSRKRRDAKPFALMVRDLAEAARLCAVSPVESELLASPARPIVLLGRRTDATGPVPADGVAPRLRNLGVMLPYTPLHHLLLDTVGGPLVMTSGNLSDEPIASEDGDAFARLGGVADLFLLHDRPIQTRCDDSIARVERGEPVLVRRARGYVPLPLPLPLGSPRPILAVGAELKNAFALVRDGDVFLSPHLGDVADERAWRAWLAMLEHYEHVFELSPTVVAHDMHPGYRTTAYAAARDDVERIAVQHHHAHVASCLADNGVSGPAIGIAWDGTGYGADGTVWGGEFMIADLVRFERIGHLEPVPLPGGEAAIREPWRMAAVFLRAAYGEAMDTLDLAFVRRLDRPAWRILTAAVDRGLNTPATSSAGRLFDGIASLLGIRDTVEFEAQAAIELEASATADADRGYAVGLTSGPGAFAVRTTDLIRGVVDDLLAGTEPGRIAARVHATLADVILAGCARAREQTGLGIVALSGGVFQNRRLTRATVSALETAGFTVLTHRHVPTNDGGIALGQAAVAAARLAAAEARA